jgi:hypothetical protein
MSEHENLAEATEGEGEDDTLITQALRGRCAVCENPLPDEAEKCPACGTPVLEDDSSFSVSEGPDGAVHRGEAGAEGSQLDRRANYKMMIKITDGILDGSVRRDEFEQGLQRLTHILNNALRVTQTSAFQTQIARLGDEAVQMAEQVVTAFQQSLEGVETMRNYLQSGDANDVLNGRASVETAFALLEQLETASKNLK